MCKHIKNAAQHFFCEKLMISCFCPSSPVKANLGSFNWTWKADMHQLASMSQVKRASPSVDYLGETYLTYHVLNGMVPWTRA